MDKQSELHQCSATIFDIPSHLIASVCQFIIDGNYRSKNGAKSVSEDVENLAKTCRYFDTIVKSANLGIPHHIVSKFSPRRIRTRVVIGQDLLEN